MWYFIISGAIILGVGLLCCINPIRVANIFWAPLLRAFGIFGIRISLEENLNIAAVVMRVCGGVMIMTGVLIVIVHTLEIIGII